MSAKIFDVALQITGDKELVKNLEALRTKDVLRIVRPAFKAGAAVVARDAKRRVPKRTGFLKKAIKAIAARRDASALVVMNRAVANPAEMRSVSGTRGRVRRPYRPAYIARIVERGAHLKNGGKVAAQPFLVPALEAKRQQALDKIAAVIRKRFS